MKTLVVIVAALTLIGNAAHAQGDGSIASVQQALKDQGFYYGEVTGRKDADTSAAIRRYQIRNGLQITGDLNAETRKSLGIKGGAPTARATPTAAPRQPAPQATPRQLPQQPPVSVPAPQPQGEPSDTSDLLDDSSADEEAPLTEDDGYRTERPPSGYAPAPPQRGFGQSPTSRAFYGTEFEAAPPEVQQRMIVGAQTLLMRQGFYRSGIDGIYGPAMEFALRAYQSRFDLEPSGRLDLETLASLGLLPGQQTREPRGPRRRIWRRPLMIDPGGERIYIPR
jgi:peptidoglycan hydrolase-like protein with peptidoglycan-binding domain